MERDIFGDSPSVRMHQDIEEALGSMENLVHAFFRDHGRGNVRWEEQQQHFEMQISYVCTV